MNPREAEKLLGGHATGTLTEDERRTLYAAALAHQEIFDALMDEEALRELLANPETKAQLLAALAPASAPKVVPFWRRTGVLGAAAGLLMAATAGLVVLRGPEKVPPPLQQEVPRAAETKASVAPPTESHVRKAVPPAPPKVASTLNRAAEAPAPASPAPVTHLDTAPAVGANASSLEDGSRFRAQVQAQAEYRRAEAQDKVSKKAEAFRPTGGAMMDSAGAMSPVPAAPLPAKPMAKAKAGPQASSRPEAVAIRLTPRWALEALADGRTRVTILAPRGPEAVLLRRRSTTVEVLRLRASSGSEEGLVLWQTEVRLGPGDALDLYLVATPMADPAHLPETGPLDGYRVRIYPASGQ